MIRSHMWIKRILTEILSVRYVAVGSKTKTQKKQKNDNKNKNTIFFKSNDHLTSLSN